MSCRRRLKKTKTFNSDRWITNYHTNCHHHCSYISNAEYFFICSNSLQTMNNGGIIVVKMADGLCSVSTSYASGSLCKTREKQCFDRLNKNWSDFKPPEVVDRKSQTNLIIPGSPQNHTNIIQWPLWWVYCHLCAGHMYWFWGEIKANNQQLSRKDKCKSAVPVKWAFQHQLT